MARARIRPLPIYLDGKKAAEITKGKLSLASGDEMQIGTDGYLGHSDGATTSKVTPTVITPVTPGAGKLLRDAMLAKKYITVGIPIEGDFLQMDMRVVSGDWDWDFKSGTTTGDLSLEGGEPAVA